MTADAVIGSESVDAGPEALHLETASGATRNIPWSAIKLAGMGDRLNDEVEVRRVAERVAPFRATHDSLWIVYSPAGFVRAMIEKSGPRRDAILAAFANHLGSRWRDDELTEPELTRRDLDSAQGSNPEGGHRDAHRVIDRLFRDRCDFVFHAWREAYRAVIFGHATSTPCAIMLF